MLQQATSIDMYYTDLYGYKAGNPILGRGLRVKELPHDGKLIACRTKRIMETPSDILYVAFGSVQSVLLCQESQRNQQSNKYRSRQAGCRTKHYNLHLEAVCILGFYEAGYKKIFRSLRSQTITRICHRLHVYPSAKCPLALPGPSVRSGL